MSRNLEGCNEVLNDNPTRWLVTLTLVPFDRARGVVTETREIETEPSLWWKSEKWQETESVKVKGEDEPVTFDTVPIYELCVILMVHYIGGGA